MKKIIFAPTFTEGHQSSFMFKYIKNIYDDNTIIYTPKNDYLADFNSVVQEDLYYFFQNSDPRLYEGFLNYCESMPNSKCLIPNLSHPEFLLSELNIRKDLDLRLSTFSGQLFHRSKARRKVLSELLKKFSIKKIIIQSILGKNFRLHESINDYDFSINKHVYLDEPFYDEEYLFEKNIEQENDKALYFGTMFYGKGVDILIEAANFIQSNTKLTIAGNLKTQNFDMPSVPENITLKDKYFEDEEMIDEFLSSKFIVLPYRDTYKHGTSGVLVQACRSGKPVIVPDIAPFSDVIKRHKIGITFKANDPISLAKAIDKMSAMDIGKEFKYKVKSYIAEMTTWDDLNREVWS
ncbi:MAG: glycosyltransferase [SAR86 cluster bacterium]|nr:glycosyltransferase [SAR86 cluster bacterium]